ncbi:MAG: hypothetical protein Q8O70_12255 [Burkholderiales bacterium]|nr:hypothetical protein [Burkholderiales bacterium]
MSETGPGQIWETFVRSPEQLNEDVDIPLIIRDLTAGRTKYRMRHVVARISSAWQAIAGGDILWVRTTVGVRLEHPWTIKVVRELPLELPGSPYRDVYEALKNAAKMGF